MIKYYMNLIRNYSDQFNFMVFENTNSKYDESYDSLRFED